MNFYKKFNMDDRFCPNGHKWIMVDSSIVFSNYYYCEKCDEIYVPSAEIKTKEWFIENFYSDKRTDLVNLARIIKARQKVTTKDLKKLGYL